MRDITIQLLRYLSISPENVDGVFVTSFTIENIIFRPPFDPQGENENSETLLHIYMTPPTISQKMIRLLCKM